MANVLAYVEIRDATAGKISREVLTVAHAMASALGGQVHAVVLAANAATAAVAELGSYGADKIFVREDENLALYQPDENAAAVTALAESGQYGAVLFPATARGKDLAPRVGAKLRRGVATEVVAWDVEDGGIVVQRPMFAGKATGTLKFTTAPALMTLRLNVFVPEEKTAAGKIIPLEAADGLVRVTATALEQGDRNKLDVGEASIVVSGGRGMQGPENWHLLEELVEALGDEAALGASRAVVDAGWRPHAEQVGQTGKTISPDLYFAVGVSGAIQHLAGIRTAKVIVAINRDADAPIFGVSNYGIVGDLFEVVPALTEAIRQDRRGG